MQKVDAKVKATRLALMELKRQLLTDTTKHIERLNKGEARQTVS